jgi:hypothetical protein
MQSQVARQKTFLKSAKSFFGNIVHEKKPAPKHTVSDTRLGMLIAEESVRPNVGYQMNSMAHQYGLNAQDILNAGHQSVQMVRNCDRCAVAKSCFRNERGEKQADVGINPRDCPNASKFRELARYLGRRTAIKNGLL